MPGGFGAAKNLSNFATNGSGGTVNSEVKAIIRNLFTQGKPIGAACIAPAIVALSLVGDHVELSVGAEGDAVSIPYEAIVRGNLIDEG